MMKIFIEGMLLSVALFLFCYIKKKKSPVNLVYFYEYACAVSGCGGDFGRDFFADILGR